MPSFNYRASTFCCLFLIASLCYGSDLKITRRVTTDAHSESSTEYSSGTRSRSESRDYRMYPLWSGGPSAPFFGHRVATIYQCDAKRVLELDLDAREYTSHESDEQGQLVYARPRSISNVPSGGTLTINVTDVDTGEKRVMFGYPAEHIVRTEKRVPSPQAVSREEESERDGWYIDIQAPRGCPTWEPFPGSGAIVFRAVSGGVERVDKIEVHHTGANEGGFPVKLTITSGRDADSPSMVNARPRPYRMEVTELSTAPIDPALFDVPRGFTQVTDLRTLPPSPPSSGFQRIMAWVKQRISEGFR